MTRRQRHAKKGAARRFSPRAQYSPRDSMFSFAHHARTYTVILLIALSTFLLTAMGLYAGSPTAVQPLTGKAIAYEDNGGILPQPLKEYSLRRGQSYQPSHEEIVLCNSRLVSEALEPLPYDYVKTTLSPFVRKETYEADRSFCRISTNLFGVKHCQSSSSTEQRSALIQEICLRSPQLQRFTPSCYFVIQDDKDTVPCGLVLVPPEGR